MGAWVKIEAYSEPLRCGLLYLLRERGYPVAVIARAYPFDSVPARGI